MTPELLWKLGRVTAVGITRDGKNVVYSVGTPDIDANKIISKKYIIPIAGGMPQEIDHVDEYMKIKNIAPDGEHQITAEEVKVEKVFGKDFYPRYDSSRVMIYTDLMYRHWDQWEDGKFSHLMVHNLQDGKSVGNAVDIMQGEPYDCPQNPFGGDEDFTWSPDSKQILYVTKKKVGKAYALSTNTDIYAYDLNTGKTANLTEGLMGYDTSPAFSVNNDLAWLSMKTDGYEADKNDIMVKKGAGRINLTRDWDGTVEHFLWSADGKKIYFNAPVDGTIQLFEINVPANGKKKPTVKQITDGIFDINDLVGQSDNLLIVTRTDMNHASELYRVDLKNGNMEQLTHVNDAFYQSIEPGKIEKRYFTTTDDKQMLTWVIYPPNFDPEKKYPTLLYCQGGPQSALSQFYSFRWNFQLMAANGYIIVAPDRRGMPGFGVKWNEEISKDWGGQAMRDYLTAIDDMAKEPFVDNNRLGCVGASFGGYSVYYLEGIHNHRFKTFIAHDGVFDLRSMYGTTEELWFANWDIGGPYWEKDNKAAQNSYREFNPINLVSNWDTPIMIIQGGHDYRVPVGQGLAAFQAAQLRGIKSKLLYFPYENHWILKPQNGLVWQHEFFKWLKETL